MRMIKIGFVFVGLVLLFAVSISCGSEESDIRARGNPVPAKAIDQVLREQTRAMMSVPGVVGTGQGLCEGKPCIKVFVIKRSAELDKRIPGTLEGYPVVIEEIGEVKALPTK